MEKKKNNTDEKLNYFIKKQILKAAVIKAQLKKIKKSKKRIRNGVNFGLFNFLDFITSNLNIFKNFDVKSNVNNSNLRNNYVVPTANNNIYFIVNNHVAARKSEESFSISDKMKEEIGRSSIKAIQEQNREQLENDEYLKQYIKSHNIEDLYPKNIIDFVEKVSDGSISSEREHVKEKAKDNDDILEEVNLLKEIEKINEEQDKQTKKRDDDVRLRHINVPIYAREMISTICRENSDLDISKIKHVIEVRNANSLGDKVRNAELTSYDGKAYCLVFSDKSAKMSDRVVMVQGDKIVDERVYDRVLSNLADDKRHKSVIENMVDNDSQILYTDVDGNDFVASLEKEPRDLTIDQKNILIEKLKNIEKKEEAILEDMTISPEEKFDKISELQSDRIEAVKEQGFKIPEIESEMEADKEKVGKVVKDSKVDDKTKEDEVRTLGNDASSERKRFL